jgi:fatty acid desaturase
LATNLNYHVEHHVLQVVPHANLPDLRPLIKQALYNLGLPYHEQDMLEYLKMFRREDFHVLERGTMRELSAS